MNYTTTYADLGNIPIVYYANNCTDMNQVFGETFTTHDGVCSISCLYISYTNADGEIFCGDSCTQIKLTLKLTSPLYNLLDGTCSLTPLATTYYYNYDENYTAADCMTIGNALNLTLFNTGGTCYESCHQPNVSFQRIVSSAVAEYYCGVSCKAIKTYINTGMPGAITSIFNNSGVCEVSCTGV